MSRLSVLVAVSVVAGAVCAGAALPQPLAGLLPVCLALLALPVVSAAVIVRLKFPPLQKGVVGFFHPYADGGGGGERVLWCAVQAIMESHPSWEVVIYSGDNGSSAELADGAAKRFGITLGKDFHVVHLQGRPLVEAHSYPKFTLAGQALGSIRLAWEALSQLRPQVFVDTAGYAFTYPLAAACGSSVAAYVHYPTISTDMLRRVASRQAAYNNNSGVAGSSWKSAAKLGYYYAFAFVYGLVGACPQVAMVNSSWTEDHITKLWWRLRPPAKVFPPCNTSSMEALPLERDASQLPYIISVAQFRPEKAHRLQLEAFALARHRSATGEAAGAKTERVLSSKLLLVGGCRHEEDHQRVNGLRALAAELGIATHVEFHVGVSLAELLRLLGGALGGIHTMIDEHFGISVVEYMAAGIVPIAHCSGGPKADIVVPQVNEGGKEQPTGFLATTAEEYADAIIEVLSMEEERRVAMARAGRDLCGRFSDQKFANAFLRAMDPLLS